MPDCKVHDLVFGFCRNVFQSSSTFFPGNWIIVLEREFTLCLITRDIYISDNYDTGPVSRIVLSIDLGDSLIRVEIEKDLKRCFSNMILICHQDISSFVKLCVCPRYVIRLRSLVSTVNSVNLILF